jgi:CBS domain-containing protein
MLARDMMQPTSEVVHVDQTLMDAGIRLRRRALPALAVVDGDEIVGLLSAETVERKMAATENDLGDAKVRDHMSAEVAFCRADESLETARAVLRDGDHAYLLVTDSKGRLCGLLSAAQIDAQGDAAGTGDAAAADAHVISTPGRAKGDKPHKPGTYSVNPKLKK